MRVAFMMSVSAFAVGMAAAWQASAADDQQPPTLDTVVITAQKRTEKLEEVPVAASVVSGAALSKSNVSDIADLNNLVPSVELNGTINGRVPMGIRGVSTDSNEGAVGVPSGVAINIDGVPTPSDSYAGNALDDVQSVEVLKGPQSTLGGRTAAAGVINIVTRQPSTTFKAGATVTATTDREVRVTGYVSGPISDKAQFSIAGWDGRVYYPITNTYYGSKTYQDTYGARAKLHVDVNDKLDFTVTGRLSEANSQGFNFVYTYFTPGATLLFPGSPLTQSLLLPGINVNQNNLTYSSPVTQAASTVQDAETSAIINYRIGQDTLTSTTSYLDERQHNTQDLFATNVYFFTVLTGGAAPYDDTQTQHEHVQQVTEELKLVSPTDQKLSYIVGAFFSDTKVDETIFRALPPAGENLEVTPDTATYDLYGRLTYRLTDQTDLIGGLRYNYDVLKYNDDQLTYVPYGAFASAGQTTDSNVVGDITLQHKLDANSMVYGTYSRGYSPKVYNTALPLTSDTPITPVNKETVDNFEIGTKGTYFEHRLMVNFDLFYTNYQNFQIQQPLPIPGVTNPPLALVNGGARTEGAELDTAFQATSNLKLTASAAYIDAIFTNYKNAPCYGNTIVGGATVVPSVCTLDASTGELVQDVSGKTMPNSPKFKFVLGAEQRVPLADTPYSLVFGGTYAYRTSAEMLADQNPEAVQKAFGLLNLSAALQNDRSHWSVSLFVNNVFNKIYYTDMEDFWSSPWAGYNTVIAQPARDAQRYAGVKVSAQF